MSKLKKERQENYSKVDFNIFNCLIVISLKKVDAISKFNKRSRMKSGSLSAAAEEINDEEYLRDILYNEDSDSDSELEFIADADSENEDSDEDYRNVDDYIDDSDSDIFL